MTTPEQDSRHAVSSSPCRALRPFAGSAALLLGLVLSSPALHAQVYKCVDEQGRVTYTNDRGAARGCTSLSQNLPISSVPAPARSPSARPPASATPGDFPRVSPSAQRERDDSRRGILQAELDQEQRALTEARDKLAEEEARDAPEDRNAARPTASGGTQRTLNMAKRDARLQPYRDKVELHQRNVEAIQRELSALR